MLELAVICFFILLLLATFLFIRAVVLRTDPVATRLAAEQDVDEERPLGDLTESFATQIKQSAKEMSEVERDLRRAGRYHKHAYADFQGSRVFMAVIIIAAAAGMILIVGPENTTPVIWIGAVGLALAAFSYVIPRFVLSSEGNRRVGRLERGLPDSLDMMTMSIAGGLTLRQSLEHVSREIRPAHPELAFELAIVNEQARLGSINQAFSNFGDRTDSTEIRSLAALVGDSEKLGTNVESTIRDHADSIRRSIRQRADERASKTNVKLIMPFALLLVPAMLLVIWAPPLLTLGAALERELGPGGALSPETLNASISDATLDPNQSRTANNANDQNSRFTRDVGPRDVDGGQRAPSRTETVFGSTTSDLDAFRNRQRQQAAPNQLQNR